MKLGKLKVNNGKVGETKLKVYKMMEIHNFGDPDVHDFRVEISNQTNVMIR